MRIFKCVYNALYHSNEICHNLLHTELNCMQYASSFSENYQYLSHKYLLSGRDWYNDLEHLLGKVQMKFAELFLCSPTAGNVVEPCSIRDDNIVKILVN